MKKEFEGILAGMIFGDGSVCYRKRFNKDKNGAPKYEYETSAITIGHSIKQKEYLEHKRDLIHKIFGGKKPDIQIYDHFLPATEKYYTLCRFQKTHKSLRLIYPKFYPNKKKTYTFENLSMLTEEGLAYWYMDDGSCHVHRRADGSVSNCSCDISTYCSEEEAKLICGMLQKMFGLGAKVGYSKVKNGHIIRFNTTQSRVLRKIIEPYIIPSMRYKIEFIGL